MNNLAVTSTLCLFLIGCALIGESARWPRLNPVLHHPVIHLLSLSSLTCGWAILGSVGFAYQFGYSFLTYFLGMATAFMLTPLMLLPLHRLCQLYQFSTLADVFAYRYDHTLAGTLASVIITLSLTPLLAAQMQALQQVLTYLLTDTYAQWALPAYLIAIGGLLILSFRQESASSLRGLLAGLGIMKLVGFIALAVLFTHSLFGNYSGLSHWLQQQPQALHILYGNNEQSSWRSLMLAFFVAVLALPHGFDLLFAGKTSLRQLYQTAWMLPVYLWCLALCVPFILWAGIKADVATNPEYFAVGIGLALNHPFMQWLALWVILCAISAVLLAAPLACGKLVVNFMLLPRYRAWQHPRLWQRMRTAQVAAAVLILILAYGFYLLLQNSRDLSELTLLAFIGTLQLLPGILGVIFWSRATLAGLLTGLLIGLLLWIITLVLPLLAYTSPPLSFWFDLGFTPGIENWQLPALLSLSLNSALFIGVSWLTKQRDTEKEAAISCSQPQMRRSYRQRLPIHTIAELVDSLCHVLHPDIAQNLTQQAMQTLNLSANQTSPYALRRLREQLQMLLTHKIGPLLARRLLDKCLPFAPQNQHSLPIDIQLIEQKLDDYRDHLSGLAAELDHVRRLYRKTLQQLPVGVVSLSQDGEILSWNMAMQQLSGLSADSLLGGDIHRLPSPWRKLLTERSYTQVARTHEITLQHQRRWLHLHGIDIRAKTAPYEVLGQTLVIEDLTQTKQLEASLTHSERLAAIGRLAAGVAHEIGNPVTAIACLAQELPYHTIDPDQAQQQLSALSQPFLQQTQRITQIVDALTHFSYAGENSAQNHITLQLHTVLEDALHLANLTRKTQHHNLVVDFPVGQWVLGNAQRLQQVLLNLISNACDAAPAGSVIRFSHQPSATQVIIQVQDQGSGIPSSWIDRVRDPFTTSKAAGKGTGLGLYLADSIIKEHRGELEIVSPHPDGSPGTCVAIKLPKA